ncbi:hypothetical protein [Paenibacillus kribbensis]|nr:hypothetical protein [Paenibacillus kribbensis]
MQLAKEIGATHIINGKETDLVQTIEKITNGGMWSGTHGRRKGGFKG